MRIVLKLLGNIKLILSAKVAACFINFIAIKDCLPNVRLPIT